MAEVWPTNVPQDPRFPAVVFPAGTRAWAPGEALWLAKQEEES